MLQSNRLMNSALLTGLLMLLIASSPAFADGIPWLLRGNASLTLTDGRSQQNLAGGSQETSIPDDELGFSLTIEAMVRERIGIEFGALLVASPKISSDVEDGSGIFEVSDSLGLTVLGAGVNFHLTPDKRVDVYLGPFIGHALLGNLSFDTPQGRADFRVDNEFVVGGVVGIDVPFSDSWSFNAAARYMPLDIELRGADGRSDPIPIDPASYGVGFTLKF